jgi:hypothetical protein
MNKWFDFGLSLIKALSRPELVWALSKAEVEMPEVQRATDTVYHTAIVTKEQSSWQTQTLQKGRQGSEGGGI